MPTPLSHDSCTEESCEIPMRVRRLEQGIQQANRKASANGGGGLRETPRAFRQGIDAGNQ
jgi:hypothetical protein